MNDDGHPDWNINLQTGEATVANPAGPTTTSPTSEPETPSPVGEAGEPAPTPTATPQAPKPAQGDDFIPKYRFDEINRRAAEQQTRIAELTDLLRQALQKGADPGQPQPPQRPLTEEERAFQEKAEEVRQDFYRYFPEYVGMKERLDKMAEMLDKLAPVAEEVPRLREREDVQWQTLARTTLDRVQEEVGKTYGTGPLDSASETAANVREAFVRWCRADADRVARYERSDPSLVKQFVDHYGSVYVNPWRPPSAASPSASPAQNAARRVARLPVSGPSAIPAPTMPAKRDNTNEEAVHADAWAYVRNQAAATGQ